MKALSQKDHQQISKLHQIYSTVVPPIISELLETPEMSRLKTVSQNCGRDYLSPKLNTFSFGYSRFDHSLGVALIVWNFTHDVAQSVAGLFHDISMPAFSHVIDFYNNDKILQESTEKSTAKIIKNSAKIKKILKKYNVNIDEVVDYSIYPIADSPAPRLAADRLEYNFYMAVSGGTADFKKLEKIYQDLTIAENEDKKDELVFKTATLAADFAGICLKNGKYMIGEVSTISNEFLASILKKAVEKGLFEADFTVLRESEIVEILDDTKIPEISKPWQIFKTITEIHSSNTLKEAYFIAKNDAKKRYVDPLVRTDVGTKRIGELNNNVYKNIEDFLNAPDVFYFIEVPKNSLI